MSHRMHSDYHIGVNDKRFEDTWNRWSERIVELIYKTAEVSIPGARYGGPYFDFMVRATPNKTTHPPLLQIPKDILASVKYLASTAYLDTYYLSYDTDYVNQVELNEICEYYTQVRRRKDYELATSSAYSLTLALDSDLLDYPIPRISIVAITYNGERPRYNNEGFR